MIGTILQYTLQAIGVMAALISIYTFVIGRLSISFTINKKTIEYVGQLKVY